MMGRTKTWAIVAALTLLPGVALAQAANQGPTKAGPAVTATTAQAPRDAAPAPAAAPTQDDQGTTARTVAPEIRPEQAAAEAATAVKPQLAPGESLAPATPAGVDGQGSVSEALSAAADKSTPFEGMKPEPDIGQPDGGWNLQGQHTEIGQYARWFNDSVLLPLMAVVTLIVFVLLFFAMVRFWHRRNPVPSKTSHHTLVEVIWTVVPVLILVAVAVPSFRLLANQYDPPKPDLTIKAIGHQWYWEYEYSDHGAFTFDSIMLNEQDSEARGEPRLLAVDNRVVVPAGATVKVLVTSVDVIHSWAIPSFWVKMDAVPGRINETWFKVDRPGVYYGQCSELCGTKHGFMPIAVEVVEPARYNAWAAAKEAENGSPAGPRFERAADGKLIRIAAAAAPAAAGTPATPAPAAAAPTL